MTAKRFRAIYCDDYAMDYITDNGKQMHIDDVVECLNHLHEENKRLKKLNIPIDEIKDTVSDYRGRIIGVYYND